MYVGWGNHDVCEWLGSCSFFCGEVAMKDVGCEVEKVGLGGKKLSIEYYKKSGTVRTRLLCVC